jgi:predicted cation transporter
VSVIIALSVILLAVLFLPFFVHFVEENLEIFLFIMGALAITVTSQWRWSLVEEALVEPIKITAAVFVAGFLFRLLRPKMRKAIDGAIAAVGVKVFAFIVVVLLGLISSVITAIIASLILVEVIDCMKLDRRDEIKIVVISCFAIGMGAVLTPLGEPLATIAISKLKGEPYKADFWFLAKQFWYFVVPGILVFGGLAALFVKNGTSEATSLKEDRAENMKDIVFRAAKTYLFVMALVFLGTGFKPIIDAFIIKLPSQGLYWINSISAILDNATLAAAEVSPSMSIGQLTYALLGLIIAGGMLIPGNIPNIISAGKLSIKSKEWISVGVPLGAVVMVLYFVLLLFVR